MKYVVTFCALDEATGSNPFWHSCLLLSQWKGAGEKLEVVDQFGFYGAPSTTGDSLMSRLKIKLGLDVDLHGNHGMLRHEELRFLDLGRGLHGVNFELSEEKFTELHNKCKSILDNQDRAIEEMIGSLGLQGKPPHQTRLYSLEAYSSHIYALELAKANQEGRPSRLMPFELRASMSVFGPTIKNSTTCKSQALSLLEGVLTEQQIHRLRGRNAKIPRLTGRMEKIFLHSTGPFRTHIKHSGAKVYYREFSDAGVQLHWTLPPQEIEVLSDDTNTLFQLSEGYGVEVKVVIERLQRLEWLFTNATLPEGFAQYRTELITRIREAYEVFASIQYKQSGATITGFKGYAYRFMSLARDEHEQVLLDHLSQAKQLFNRLYMAMIDEWQIDDDHDSEILNPLEAMAAYLRLEDKQQLCSIIDRDYLDAFSQHEDDRENAPHFLALGMPF